MNEKYFDCIKKLKIKNIVQIVSGICLIISPVFCYLAFYSKNWIWFVYFLCLFVLSLFSVIKYSTIKEYTEEKTPYSISTKDKVTFETIKNQVLENYNVKTKKYAKSQVFFFKSRMKYRFTLYQIDDFSVDEFMHIKKNTNYKVNKDFEITNKVSFYDNKRCAINVIVTKQENAELIDFLSKDASIGMRRHQSIINIAICQETNVVLIPRLIANATLLHIKKYENNIKLICELTDTKYKN